MVGGESTYYRYCSACHQHNGKGAGGRFPPLVETDWVTGDKDRLIQVLLNGMEGSIEIGGQVFNGVMPQHAFLSDKEIADVLTYIRSNFGNNANAVSTDEVSKIRKALEDSGVPSAPMKVSTE